MKQHAIGLLAGALAGCCVVLAALGKKRDGSIKGKYDERQQVVRGRAFQYGFVGWMIFTAFCILSDIGLEIQFMDLSMTLFCGMLIGVTIYVVYSVWYDGYIPLKKNPKRILKILITVTLMNALCAVYRIRHGLLEHGVLTFLNGVNLLLTVAFTILLTVMFVKWTKERQNTDKGEQT